MNKLTLKQQRFADEYIISGNATAAAIKAGYSKKTARVTAQENLTKPAIRTYIDERLEKLHTEKIADQREVLQYLTSVMRGEQVEETVINAGDYTQEITEIKVGAKDRIKAAELIGKRYGVWTDKVKAEVDVSSTDKLDSLVAQLGE
ncbi:terminase small subunit [Gemella sp. GH3]|uniref:terminase small subunit n=1 Tax=unclassified Gemella TaxID=2624949 RepID=UPI0015D06392|nr:MULTISPECIES: terminase small subunit [unclassified Gemella]MBF0714505.1 terminase small subunit [Gemella sp. GH3.1]NYS51457.1 terminase small subunit [Gemella sp. GH3]